MHGYVHRARRHVEDAKRLGFALLSVGYGIRAASKPAPENAVLFVQALAYALLEYAEGREGHARSQAKVRAYGLLLSVGAAGYAFPALNPHKHFTDLLGIAAAGLAIKHYAGPESGRDSLYAWAISAYHLVYVVDWLRGRGDGVELPLLLAGRSALVYAFLREATLS